MPHMLEIFRKLTADKMCVGAKEQWKAPGSRLCQLCHLALEVSANSQERSVCAVVAFEMHLTLLTSVLTMDSDLLVKDFGVRQSHNGSAEKDNKFMIRDKKQRLLFYNPIVNRKMKLGLLGGSCRPQIHISIKGEFCCSPFPCFCTFQLLCQGLNSIS